MMCPPYARRFCSPSLLPLMLLFLWPTTARADYIFNWGPDIPTVYSDASGMQVDLSDMPQGGPVTGTQTMTATVLTTLISPGVTGTDTFSNGQRVALGVDILDGTEHGNLTFPVAISGSLSADGSNLSLDFPDGKTKSVTVNGQLYTVSLVGSGAIPGSLEAQIVTGEDPLPVPEPEPEPEPTGVSPTANAPEPSALVLAVMAIAALGSRRWIRSPLAGQPPARTE